MHGGWEPPLPSPWGQRDWGAEGQVPLPPLACLLSVVPEPLMGVLGEGEGPQSKNTGLGTSLAVQWLRLHASTAGGTSSIPGRGTKIPHAASHGQKNNKNKVPIVHIRPQIISYKLILKNEYRVGTPL